VRPIVIAVGVSLAATCLAASASAAPHAAAGPAWGATRGDPWERSNRTGFAIEQALDRAIIGPATKVNKFLTPGIIGKAIHNFLVNLGEPLVVANDMLQLRPARAGKALVRFVVNSVFGVAGTIDAAGKGGIPHRNSSFGDTLARYGVKPGPYIFLPLIGPSTVRDLFGNGVDDVMNPVNFVAYPYRTETAITLAVTGGLDQRLLNDEDLRTLLGQAADPYATLRSTYLQNREGEINGGKPPATLPDLEDPGAPAASSSVAPAGQSDVVPPAGDKAAPLKALPDQQGGNPDGQVPGALDQGQSQGHLGAQAENGTEDGIGRLLDADAGGGDDNSAAHGRHQTFDRDD
jgi:phospholipid-binding lipoprotein MlaA